MAGRPCSICNHRFVGPSSGLYIHVRGTDTELGNQLKLCPVHYGEIRNAYVQVDGLIGTHDEEPIRNDHCLFCDEVHDKRSSLAVYATGFPPHAEREDFYGVVGTHCVADLADAWSLLPEA